MAEKKETRRPFKHCIPEEAAEHARTARQEMRQSFEALFPPEFISHRRAARKEMLMAARSVIEAAIDHLETREA